jgi:hypothetical protein
MTTPNPPNISIPALHDALTREVLAHFNGIAVTAPIVLFDDADGTFNRFCHCERCKTLQQFLFFHRAAHARLPAAHATPPAADADSDASIASTLRRATPPLAAAATPPDGDSDSGIDGYPDGDEHIPNAGVVNSSDSSAAESDGSSSERHHRARRH